MADNCTIVPLIEKVPPDPKMPLLLKVNTVYFQYSDTRQEKTLLCAQNCTMTSCYVMSHHVMLHHVMLRYVTSRHVIVYFQLAMLSALLD